jgi:carbonic anhydrase
MTRHSARIDRIARVVIAGLAITACSEQAREAADTTAATATPPAKTTAIATPTTPHWDYGAERGPATWATIAPEFATCGSGKSQSPIDIAKATSGKLDDVATSYSPTELKVVHHEHVADGINNGHTIQVNYTGADSLTVAGQRFALLQYHFHAPSENTMEGKHFPMEIHLVHRSASGQLAVLAAFIEEGAENAAYAPVWSNLPTKKGMEFHLEHLKVDVDVLLPAGRASYRFDGSLTTPPCSEGVKWVVLAQPVQLSAAQIAAFKAVVDNNNRPTQPLNGRAIATDHVKETSAR